MIKNFDPMSRFVRIPFWVVCMAALFTINAGAGVVYVKQHNGLVKDGASWDTAYTDLQEAINSSGETAGVKDDVWVAAGTYKPASQPNIDPDEGNDRYRHFSLKNNVSVLGGFAGTETSIDDRDIDTNPTIISGDYGANSKCYNVFYHPSGTNLDDTAVLNGVTITGGKANGPLARGGGIYNNGSSPMISNCIFSGNIAGYGGGMANESSSPKLINCTFSDNEGIFDGGGIYNSSGSSPVLDNCTFKENYAGDYQGSGGGMYSKDSSPVLTNCRFIRNKAITDDDYEVFGGGMYNDNSTLTLSMCTFNGNTAESISDNASGGGMYNEDSSLTLAACEFIGNSSATDSIAYDDDGGGIYNEDSSLTLVNCVFSMNTSAGNGGAMFNDSSSPTLTNCILWNNTGDAGNEIFNNDAGSNPAISYCNIKDSGGSDSWSGPGVDGGNNIDMDPMFVSNPGAAGSGDFGDIHLQSGSPSIDAGDNNAANLPDKDIDGEARVYNSQVDMGVDEFTDFDGDTDPDYSDDDDDNDGLSDDEESAIGTDPKNPDTDGDSLSDGDEVNTYFTNPLKKDSDGDGVNDDKDAFPNDASEISDKDGDGTGDNRDQCDEDPGKIDPGVCGCGVADIDSDGDGTLDCNDNCQNDPDKIDPGACGCSVADMDSDGDGTPDCNDSCPDDPAKIDPGACGCGMADMDSDGDGVLDCNDNCPHDPGKIDPGACGCGMADIDSDGDGALDCRDNCPHDPGKTSPGACGCGAADIDLDGNGVPDCQDRGNWPSELDLDGNGVPDPDQDDITVVYSAIEEMYFGIVTPDEDVVEYLEWIDATTITDNTGRPDATFPFGLVTLGIQTSEPGKAIQLQVYCSTQIPEDAVWYKYDPINGWYDYSINVTVNEDGLSAIIFLEDGGIGDADGLINGFIEDPIGPAMLEGDGHYSGGGCFLQVIK